MTESTNSSNQNNLKASNVQFGEQIEITDAGFSFHPIKQCELEIDGSVYMYSESGNLEIFLLGGELEEDSSIAVLNEDLTSEVLENAGEYDLFEAGTDTVSGITGFLNEIRFSSAEEDGGGYCLICSPYLNQFFFMLLIASADFWQSEGKQIWQQLKSKITFQPQFKPEIIDRVADKHPDLTNETYESIAPEEEFLLNIEKGDISLLLAARSISSQEKVSITEIISPSDETLYRYDPVTGDFFSEFCDKPYTASNGEVCFFYPRQNQLALQPGEYRFSFDTSSSRGVQEVQIIIRSGKALGTQKFDLNFWFAMSDNPFRDQEGADQFENQIRQALSEKIAPLNLAPGKMDFLQPAPDEITSFSTINIEKDLADCSYMIAESVTNDRALNIGLVDRIIDNNAATPAEVAAISCGSPGMILSSGSPHACILLSWPEYQADLNRLAGAIIQQLIKFCGIETSDTGQPENTPEIILNREIAWRLRRHPLFYDAE